MICPLVSVTSYGVGTMPEIYLELLALIVVAAAVVRYANNSHKD
ncbi:hypothetical protein F4561_005137 [Lipingzhangella halophila]|uniref:Uncharacterized protein n=1 Tax=Lipingzhangella halophila TaxID=1783352 RepID=A0A7W7W4M3_9ACTN|nr:hypothetical protein [Lipingzhangella halophila]